MPKLKQKPVFTSLDPVTSQSANSDGALIAKFIIINHGFQSERFPLLSRKQKDYIESTLCVIINDLCYHLSLLTSLK